MNDRYQNRYRKRFMKAGQSEYYYLDLCPDVVEHKGKKHRKREVWRQGARPCFCADDLYTVRLGNWSIDQIERVFFGVPRWGVRSKR
jgi:hypothetical protein